MINRLKNPAEKIEKTGANNVPPPQLFESSHQGPQSFDPDSLQPPAQSIFAWEDAGRTGQFG